MREYRGKRIDNGEWTHGYVQFNRDKTLAWICESKEDDWTVKKQFPAEPATVGQYTGLKDKNGNKVYCGDLMDSNNSGHLVIRGMVDFRKGRYVLGQTEGREDDLHLAIEVGYTVIGNRWDNPELLEVTV